MADRVIRMHQVNEVKQETPGGKVRLMITGRVGGKTVRLELDCDTYDLTALLDASRNGVKVHVDYWTAAQRTLGTP